MERPILKEPVRTPFNPHGFMDAAPLHTFYLTLLKEGYINKEHEEGSLEFENSQLFMNIDWELASATIDEITYDVKMEIECGVVLINPKITNKLTVFISNSTLTVVLAKTFNAKSGLTVSLNFETPLRVLAQMGYYNLPFKG